MMPSLIMQSRRYQTMEKSQVQTLKDIAEFDKSDSIARARRLSQETNKRRKYVHIKMYKYLTVY